MGVIAGDQPAQRHARLGVEQRQHGIEDFTADVFKVDVHAFEAGQGQFMGEIFALVVDTGVKAQLIHHIAALVGATGNATTRKPLSLATWPTTDPTAPDAAATTRVSPALGWPISIRPI